MRLFFLFLTLCTYVTAAEFYPVKIQLGHTPRFSAAAFYVAVHKGFYRDAGLSVDIVPMGRGDNRNAATLVAAGKAEFGVDFSGVVREVAEGAPLVLLGALFEHTPMHLLVKRKAGENRVGLEGYQVFLTPQTVGRSAVSLFLFDGDDNITILPRDMEAFEACEHGAVDLFAGDEGPEEKGEGAFRYAVIDPAGYGYDFYDDLIVTSRRFWRSHPVEARRFMMATIRGWRYALTHIEESARLLKERWHIGSSVEALVKEAKACRKYAGRPDDSLGLLRMEKLELMLQRFLSSNRMVIRQSLTDGVDPLFLEHNGLISAEERQWMADHVITYSETFWPPFTIPDTDGMRGMIQDYLSLVFRHTGLLMRYVPYKRWSEVLDAVRHKRLDMAMATGETPARRKYALFSHPYGVYRFGMVMWPRVAREFRFGRGDRLTVAVGKDYTAEKILRRYSQLRIKTVADTVEGLALLEKGEVDAVADILPTLKYFIVERHLPQLKILTPFKETFPLKAMFRNDYAEAVAIFNKGLSRIDSDQRRAIWNRWQPVEIKVETKELMWQPLAIVSGIALLFAVVILLMRRQIRIRRRLAKELKRTMEIVNRYVLMCRADANGRIIYVSQALEELTGYKKEELVGKRSRILGDRQMWQALQRGETCFDELMEGVTKSGETYWVSQTVVPIRNAEGVLREIMVIRKDLTPYKKLEELVLLDPMTGAYNRRAFNRMMKERIARASRELTPFVFMVFDVDHFKEYNDRYGHLAGDEVLKQITETVKGMFRRETDAIFRLGGEEFGLLLENIKESQMPAMAQSVVKRIEALGIVHEGNENYGCVTVSLGAVFCKPAVGHLPDAACIYSRCDALMYRVKKGGRNGWACDVLELDECVE
ncbi:MAG: diguanylate cyclase [Epsilonproteobacteria bacterium]|nr:diguanylate cyclase [Campylobacterota bacterium]